MKELSIEEKAKAYDEALSVALETYQTQPMYKDWLEKMFPELKELEDERIRKAILEHIQLCTESIPDRDKFIAWIEKQGEQNLTNKIEPKFHEGEWINGYYTNYKVLSVNNGGYVVEDVDGNKINILFENERFHQLWTIQDAKDGDVLATDGGICIFDGTLEESKYPFAYCGITKQRGFESYNGNLPFSHDNNIHPATKEQRDVLMKAMADAGYTFDFEKKELKKIEQKLAEWEPQTGDIFRKKGTASPTYYLCDKLEDGITFGFVENREVGFSGGEITIFTLRQDYELVERPNSIEDVVEEELNKTLQAKDEQTPAEWSEEDEVKRNSLIGLIEEIKNQPLKRLEDWDGYISWLKSLRPQNNITDEELAKAKKDAYIDALNKIEYHSGNPTFDDGWSAAIWYLRRLLIMLY